MKITVDIAHFHDAVFFAEKSWGKSVKSGTINNKNSKPISLEFDTELDMLNMKCGDCESYVRSNLASFELPKTTATKTEVVNASPTRRIVRSSAQVSGPHDHVFAGQGGGKTNDPR